MKSKKKLIRVESGTSFDRSGRRSKSKGRSRSRSKSKSRSSRHVSRHESRNEIDYNESDDFSDGRDSIQEIENDILEEYYSEDDRADDHQELDVEDSINRFIQYTEFGDDTRKVMRTITIDDVPYPKSPTDVIVKVKASTVTLKDCYIRRGLWSESISLPNTPGFDIVGTVFAMGVEVERKGVLRVGDPVAACVRTGGNARYCRVCDKDIVKIPGAVDSAKGVCLVTTYMTAYQALHRVKPRKERETLEGVNILVTGGNGPIGQAVIELGMRAGANRIFATAAFVYHDALIEMGVYPLPLDHNDWLPLVKGKMDVVIDGVCQDGYDSPRAALNSTGHLIVIGQTLQLSGALPGMCGGMPIANKLNTWKSRYFMTRTSYYCPWESSQQKPEEWKHDLVYLFGLLERGMINPIIVNKIAIDHVALAQKELEAGNIDGIIVCKPWK